MDKIIIEKVQPKAVLVIGTDGKLEITGHTDIALIGSTKTELRVDPAPINLKVETTTDWPMFFATASVGIASLVTAGVVGLFTYRSSLQAADAMKKSALQAAAATAAEIRNKWMQDLRNEAGDFYAVVLDLAYAVHIGMGRATQQNEHAANVFKMHKHRALITMMLDAQKPLVQRLLEIIDAIASAVNARDKTKILAESILFNAQVTLLLEDAWQDIKNDLYGAAKRSKDDVA